MRSPCACSEIGGEGSGEAVDRPPWCADWFIDRIVHRRLQPAIQIGYRRFARTSTLGDEHLRLTIDSQIAATPSNGWNVSGTCSGALGSIADCEILELKFHNQMPHLFKELLRQFAVPATGFSKYRTAMTHGMGLGSDHDLQVSPPLLDDSVNMEAATHA